MPPAISNLVKMILRGGKALELPSGQTLIPAVMKTVAENVKHPLAKSIVTQIVNDELALIQKNKIPFVRPVKKVYHGTRSGDLKGLSALDPERSAYELQASYTSPDEDLAKKFGRVISGYVPVGTSANLHKPPGNNLIRLMAQRAGIDPFTLMALAAKETHIGKTIDPLASVLGRRGLKLAEPGESGKPTLGAYIRVGSILDSFEFAGGRRLKDLYIKQRLVSQRPLRSLEGVTREVDPVGSNITARVFAANKSRYGEPTLVSEALKEMGFETVRDVDWFYHSFKPRSKIHIKNNRELNLLFAGLGLDTPPSKKATTKDKLMLALLRSVGSRTPVPYDLKSWDAAKQEIQRLVLGTFTDLLKGFQ